jgi:N-acetylglucosaminyl-diphospho-decaprenol L-rhamnosyltransferase
MSVEPSWTLITVAYNSAPELRRWWDGVDLGGCRWIVVDNASTDDSVATARSMGAEVIALDRNVGFAAANNVALAAATSEWVAFVNPDIAVNVTTLPRLALLAARHEAIVAPQLVDPDGSVQANGRGLPFLVDKLAHRGVTLPGADVSQYLPDTSGRATYVAWVMGAAVCARRETFRRIGGWDERYFLYYEDHELGLTAWEHGIPVLVDGTVSWTHEWKRATTRWEWAPWKREIRGAMTFFRRHPELLGRRRRITAQAWADRVGGLPSPGGDR